jgi:hypothetical protein
VEQVCGADSRPFQSELYRRIGRTVVRILWYHGRDPILGNVVFREV